MSDHVMTSALSRPSAARTSQALAHALRGYAPHGLHDPADLAIATDDDEQAFTVKVVDNPGRHHRASTLIQRRYAWRGYASSPLEHSSSDRATFAACLDDATLATITAALDGSRGLYVGQLYPETVGALRAEGRRLCEFTRLAVDESVRSHAVLGAIFHVALVYVSTLNRCTDALIEVNPRHVRFYERMLGFEVAADERLDPAVGAPAVLLRLDLSHTAREIARLGGSRRRGVSERSFYPYFFAPEEAASIAARLRGH